MNFPQFDSYTGLFHFSAESPLCDFQENGSLFGCQMDRVGDIYDNGWLHDDKLVTTSSKSIPSSPIHKDTQYPQRTSLLAIKKRNLSDLPKSKPVVTKLNHFKCKDDFLLDDSKELPDVILVSPRRETTPEPKTNTVFNLDDEKTDNNLNLDFDDALRSIQVEVGKDYSVDLVTKEDVEYLDSLLVGFNDQQPVQTFDNDFLFEDVKCDVDGSDLSSFNEISCNINQQSMVGDSKSAIKTLLKNDSFKGNFSMKKSTEILSEIDQSHDCFAEHNYFSPTKILKPRTETDQTGEYMVPCATPSAPAFVPIVNEDYAVETEISSSPTLDVKTPKIVLPHCPSASKQGEVAKPRDTLKKAKKPVLPKSKNSKDDPTYKPYTSKKPIPKKSQAPRPKLENPTKPVVKQLKFGGDCNVAKLPRIPLKSSVCESKPNSCVAVVKPRMVEQMAPRVPPVTQFNYKLDKCDDPVSAVEPDPIDAANPPTPLASPTRDDIADHDEFTNDSSQPETLNSNVDCVDPVLSIEPSAPKIEKKKISLKEYLQKRGTEIKTEPENDSPDEPVAPAFVPNVEEILKTIVKSEPPPVDGISKSIVKTEPTLVKSEPPPVDEISKSIVKTEPTPAVKSKPPAIAKKSEPARVTKPIKPVVKSEHRSTTNNPVPKLRPNPAKETQNHAPFKLIKLSIPDRAPSVRSYSLSPNEVSQSLDSCDRCSSSGVSSYHNSSVSSTCGSPFNVHDDKSNDNKDFDNERLAATKIKQETIEKKLLIPFAVDEELLRKDGYSSRRHKHRKDKRRRSGSTSRKRKNSDSCFEDDSDWSDYSDRRRSRKRYISSSSSSSEKSHHRSHPSECSISPRSYREFCDWRYSQTDIVPEPYFYPNYNELPNMYYPAPPLVPWHPDFGPFYPPFVPSVEVPYFFNGSHEPPIDTGEMEVDRRALFVGNIESGLDEKEFKKRFEKYGTITHVKLHFRENLSNYGFVYFTEERYVQRAIEHGSDDPDLPHYKLGVGMRKDRYADRRAVKYEKNSMPSYPNQSYRDDPFNLKLEEFKNDLKKKKFDGRK